MPRRVIDMGRIEPNRCTGRIVGGKHAWRLDRRRRLPERSSLRPATRSISDAARPPGRSSLNRPSSTLTMVDSTPTALAPASRISLILSPRSASTWAALVALILPDVLALGAASGCPKARIRSPAKPLGSRMPTVSSPAVASAWIAAIRLQRHHDGQRTGPEGFCQRARSGRTRHTPRPSRDRPYGRSAG
jgi:hypothetical protein